MKLAKRFFVLSLALLLFGPTTQGAKGKKQEEVNLYSYRQEFLLRPFLKEFEKKTGVKVNVVYMKKGLIEKLKVEGKNTPADLVLTVSMANLEKISDLGLLRPHGSSLVQSNIPPKYRDPKGKWVGLSARGRIIYYSKKRIDPKKIKSYADLAKPEFKGRVCSRSGLHSYNVALLSSIIFHHGERYAFNWAKNLKGNLARRPQGNDRAQVRAISEGLCDLAIGNTYYMGKMLENPKQREWAANAGIIFPNQGTYGTHINLSGIGLTLRKENHENAKKLLEFFTSDLAQHLYAQVNHEYPLKDGVSLSGIVKSFGEGQGDVKEGIFKRDDQALLNLAKLNYKAIQIMNKAGFN